MATFSWTFDVDSGVSKSNAFSSVLYKQALENAVFPDHCRPVKGFGKGKGETVTWNRIAVVAEPTSAALDENVRIPEDTFDISTGSATLQELGRAIPYTSLAKDLSVFDIENPIQRGLTDQMKLVLDTLAATQFKASYLKATPTGTAAITWDTDGTITATATANVGVYHLEEIRDAMVATYLVPMINNEYIGIFHTKGLRGIKRDPDFVEWHKYTDPSVKYNSEIGKIENIRLIECYHGDALTTKASGILGEGVVFGEDAVVLAEAQAPELRAAMPEDFGRAKAVAWYGILKFAPVWSATVTAGQVRIVHVTSA